MAFGTSWRDRRWQRTLLVMTPLLLLGAPLTPGDDAIGAVAITVADTLRPGAASSGEPIRATRPPVAERAWSPWGDTTSTLGETGSDDALARAVRATVEGGIRAGAYPGAAVVIRRGGRTVHAAGYGRLDWQPGSPAVDAARTIYDLASLTKVLATTNAVLVLADQGRLDLDAPVGRWLPAWREGNKARVTVRHLLQHRSGLPAGRSLWQIPGTPADRRESVLATRLVSAPGARTVYSDLGADILGYVVEAIAKRPFEQAVSQLVLSPLRIPDVGFRPPAVLQHRIAPTEVRPPRGYPVRGEVHDENAHALGGVAGHAGLFGSAIGVARLAEAMLGSSLASPATVAEFRRRGADPTRALGWELCQQRATSTCGRLLSAEAFGHTGYTGTSVWIDPTTDLVVVVLANRVHDPRTKRAMAIMRTVRGGVAEAAGRATALALRGEAEGAARLADAAATGRVEAVELRATR